MHLFKRLLLISALVSALVAFSAGYLASEMRQHPSLTARQSSALTVLSDASQWHDVSSRRRSFAQLVQTLQPYSLELQDHDGTTLEYYQSGVAHKWPVASMRLSLPVQHQMGEARLVLNLPQTPMWQGWGWLAVFWLLFNSVSAWWIWRALIHERVVRQRADQVLAGERDPTVIDAPLDHVVLAAFARLLRENHELQQAQLKAVEQVKQRTFVDAETGLGNRAYFDAHLEVLLRDRDAHVSGILMLIELADIQLSEPEVQRHFAHVVGELLRLHVRAFDEPVLARRDEHTFSVLLPGMNKKEVGNFSRKLLREMTQHVERGGGNAKYAVAHIGAVEYRAGVDSYTLLSEADMALRVAQQSDNDSGYHIFEHGEIKPGSIMGRVRWRALLEKVIEQRRVQLHYHPVVVGADRRIAHYEVLSRIVSDDGELFSAATFMPMAHRVGLAVPYDRMVCDTILKSLLFGPQHSPIIAVNLSGDALADNGFRMWLLEHLAENRPLAERLVFEIGESVAAHLQSAELNFLEVLVRCGAALGVEHVGHPQYSANYLQNGLFRFVKVHRGLTRAIEHDISRQDFVRGLAEVVRARGAIALAECVESDAQWDCLLELGIRGGQGYLFGEPTNKPVKIDVGAHI